MTRLLLLLAALALADTSVREVGNLVFDGVPEAPERIRERTRQYANVRSAAVLDWDADGGGLLVSTRFGETAQVHHLDGPGRDRRQLTFLGEPVASAARDPARPQGFWYRADVGGRETWQTYWFDEATGRATLLTDGKSRNEGLVVSPKGGRVAYASNRRNNKDFDLWVLEPDGTSRLVAETEGQWNALDWSPDATRLLARQYISVTDSRLWVVDVASGKRTELAPSPTAVSHGEAAWLSDTVVVYTSDADAEYHRLVRQDVATGEKTILTPDTRWDVDGLAVSDDGKRLAWTLNEGGASALYLATAAAPAKARRVTLRTGVVTDMMFAPAGKRLAFTLNSPVSPADVWTLDVSAATPTRWTTSEVGGLPASVFIEPSLVEYPSFDGKKIPAWVYRPRAPKGKVPVILSIHGGPEGQSSATFNSTFQYWVNELGAAVIAPNVRGSTGYGKTWVKLDNGRLREDSVKDIGALLDWIATQPDLDAGRVGVTGGSYGGYMTLASLVHYGDRLRCGVDTVGISNFVTFLKNTEDYRKDLRRVEYGDERDPEMAAFLQGISPLTHADRIVSPLFVVQGLNDPRVPVSEAEQIVKTVRGRGGEVWYLLGKDEGHGFRRKSNREALLDATTLFFEQHLLPAR